MRSVQKNGIKYIASKILKKIKKISVTMECNDIIKLRL